MEVPSNPPPSVALSSGNVGWSDLFCTVCMPEAGLCSLQQRALVSSFCIVLLRPSRLGGGGGDDAIMPRTR